MQQSEDISQGGYYKTGVARKVFKFPAMFQSSKAYFQMPKQSQPAKVKLICSSFLFAELA